MDKKNTNDIPVRYRGFRVKYFGPGYKRGSRVKIIDLRHNESVTLGLEDEYRDASEQAYNFLLSKGIPISATMLERNEEIFLTNDFKTHIVQVMQERIKDLDLFIRRKGIAELLQTEEGREIIAQYLELTE